MRCRCAQHLGFGCAVDVWVQVIATHPELLGIGLDESTAIITHGNEIEVIGTSKVAIYDPKMKGRSGYHFLSPNDRYDLLRRIKITAKAH